jgi:uncharacterized protein YyaL (SSP411 family)
VTAIVTILAILGAIARLLRPLIPPGAHAFNNFGDKGGFLEQAQDEPVSWHQLRDFDFADAIRRKKPILLLTGAVWSRDGRTADRVAFIDPDVQALIGSDYIPIRIDCDESPEWLNAYYPLSYHSLGLERGCQGFILTPRGALYDYLQPGILSERADNLNFTQALLAGKGATGPNAAISGDSSRILFDDINAVMSAAPLNQIDFDGYLKSLEGATDKTNGGFPENDLQLLQANAYRFELMSGDSGVAQGITPLLHSPIVDWMDGGFFRAANRDWSDIQFDKLAVTNSEMMLSTAIYARQCHDPLAQQIAFNTFDCLTNQFGRSGGLLSSSRIGDEGENERSERCSFHAQDFRSFWNSNMLPDEDRVWAVKYLNMNPAKNSQMVPYVSDPGVLADRRELRAVLNELRSAKSDHPTRFGKIGYADINGYVAARLIECARFWNDATRVQHALELKAMLEPLRKGFDISHRWRPQASNLELTDYLGYSDAALQDFLASGRVESLETGLGVLVRAKQLFELGTPGAWLMARGSPRGLPLNYLVPEIADNVYESCTAREIRLMNAYATLLRGNDKYRDVVRNFNADVRAAIRQFAPPAKALGFHAAGFFCAAKQVADDVSVFVVGPHAETDSWRVASKLPFALVAEAKGPVRPDLQSRSAGVYICHAGQTVGPVAVEDVASSVGK